MFIKKSKSGTIVLIIVCITGLSLLLYPTIADFWNTHIALKSVSDYAAKAEEIDEDEFREIWDAAVEFNKKRAAQPGFMLPDDMTEEYYRLLDVSGTGMMGYVEIPKLGILLPVYHGTSENVLASAIGHLEWSSLPTGGESTHCSISGHRGLTSARLFTDLDQLREGDTFSLNILNETLTYEVDQIRTILPADIDDLRIEEGMDYCTLITCTPYGINTHRLLVRGHRIENKTYGIRVISEAVIIEPLIVAVVLAVPMLFILLLLVLLDKPQKPEDKSGEKTAEEEDSEWIEEFMNKLSEEDKQD